ncbi:uncharacterized protein LOC144142362 isoform X2 [Haemaphysalis longicornis]
MRDPATSADASPASSSSLCQLSGEHLSSSWESVDWRGQSERSRPQLAKHGCAYCPYTSNNRSHIEMHERTHTGGRPFECPVCRKGFTRKTHLDHHGVVHSRERRYCCPHCSLRFTHPSNLARHRKQCAQRRGLST